MVRRARAHRAALALLVVAGCGSGGDGASAAAPTESVRTPRAVVVDGASVALRVRRPRGELRGALLLLHGARYSSATWEDLGTLDRAAERGLLAVAVDLPGRPGDAPGEWTAALVAALERELDGFARPVLVAPSRAGQWALPFAAAHPERLAGLVAVAPVGADRPPPELADGDPPALVVWGEDDEVFPASGAEPLARALGDAELRVLPGAGHAAYLDRPDAFHAALFDFALAASD